MKKLLLIAAVAGALPFAVHAESNLATGTSGLTATARLDLIVTIPKVLFLQVGSGTSYAANSTVDDLNFAVQPGNVGSGTAVAAAGGNASGGSGVVVRVLGNSGNVSLTDTTAGPLKSNVSGVTTTIPWSEFKVTEVALPTATTGYATGDTITHPTFVTGSTSAATPLTATSGLVRREGSWTFSYLNSATLPAGTYGGTTNNGVVTYTATAP